MRPSEPLRLEWKDIDFDRGFLLKRKTKSNKTVQLQMNEMVTNILKDQRKLLDNSSEIMSSSKLVFPNKKGGIRRRDSYQSHFTEIRKMAGIPDEMAGIPAQIVDLDAREGRLNCPDGRFSNVQRAHSILQNPPE